MTRSFTLSLGNTPGTGARSVTEAIAFKRLLHQTIGQVAHAHLLTTETPERVRGVSIHWDADDAVAAAWAAEAVQAAPSLWCVVGRMGQRELVR